VLGGQEEDYALHCRGQARLDRKRQLVDSAVNSEYTRWVNRAVRLRDLLLVLLKVGTLGFGGGPAMLALLRRELVAKRGWITDDDLSVAVGIGQMLPGPFVPNYVEFISYRLFKIKGAILGVLTFLFPSFVLVFLISFFYCRFGTIPGIQDILRGIGPAVTAILFWSSFDMGRKMVRDYKAVIILIIAFTSLTLKFDAFFTALLCGLLGILIYGKDMPTIKAIYLPLLIQLFGVFVKIGSITFGGGYAAIPLIKSEVVDLRNWLTMKEFVDGVAIAQITPGPVAIIATFVGFKAQGFIGSIVATLGMFLPSFVMLLGLMQIYDKVKNHHLVVNFFKGIRPAIVGFLLSAAVFFSISTFIDWRYVVFGAVAFVVLLRFRIDPVFLIVAGAAFGFILRIL